MVRVMLREILDGAILIVDMVFGIDGLVFDGRELCRLPGNTVHSDRLRDRNLA